MAKKTKRGLGKGLDAIFSSSLDDINFDQTNNSITEPPVLKGDDVKQEESSTTTGSISEIPLAKIEVNPYQPRKDFDPDKLKELSESIQIHGIVQPITVRSMGDGSYQLISGERRMRASKVAGLEKIPAYIRTANDQEMLEIALIENIQREDLNAIEIAITYKRLLEEIELTHDELAKRVAKDRSTISNFIRLLKLPPEIQLALKTNTISMGHARALLSLEEKLIVQMEVYKQIIKHKLSVRKTEQLIHQYKNPKLKTEEGKKVSKALSVEYRKVQRELSEQFETKVIIRVNQDNGKGEVSFPFLSESDFNRILDLLQ